MSLRKSPTLTPAMLAANRRNAQKSTGPRSARGKSQSRMNGLKKGGRSPLLRNTLLALLNARPCRVEATARALLTPEQAAHPLFRDLVDIACQAEIGVVEQHRLDQEKK